MLRKLERGQKAQGRTAVAGDLLPPIPPKARATCDPASPESPFPSLLSAPPRPGPLPTAPQKPDQAHGPPKAGPDPWPPECTSHSL